MQDSGMMKPLTIDEAYERVRDAFKLNQLGETVSELDWLFRMVFFEGIAYATTRMDIFYHDYRNTRDYTAIRVGFERELEVERKCNKERKEKYFKIT